MTVKIKAKRFIAGLLAAVMSLGVITPIATTQTYAASAVKKITIKFDHTITYGSGQGGYTNLKTTSIDDGIDGKRPVLCMQPALASPPDGTYTIDKTIEDDGTGKWRAIRNIVYYTPGYPGYSSVKDTWFEGYTKDEAIAIMHLAVSYCFAGRPTNLTCWQGTSTSSLPDRIWNKAKAIGDQCWADDENVPSGFKVLYIAIGSYQNMVCGYMNQGKLKLTKTFLNEELTKDNACYNKAGITFTVYDIDDDKQVGQFVTDANGGVSPAEIELDEGTYRVIERHSNNGFTGNGDTQTVTVKAGGTSTVSFTDNAVSDPINVILKKQDLETDEEFPIGAASLENAEYTFRYYDGQYSSVSEAEASGEPTRSWVYRTNEKGIINFADETYKVSGDKLYTTTTGKVTLPLGTVLIQETKAPEGYLIDNTVYLRNITDPDNGKATDVTTYNMPVSSDQVKRGDLLFVKSSEGKERMAGIPFKITSKTTGESHIVITDENGYVNTSSSWNKHSENTNRGEKATDGVWFGTNSNGTVAEVNDNLGALPYDSYTIEEQRCDANKKHELVNVEATITRDNVVVNLGTIDDPLITEPEIGTTAMDSETMDNISKADDDVTIIDKVSYKDFEIGKEYTVKGKLVLKDSAETDNSEKASDTDISKLTVIDEAETKFIASKKDGTVNVVFHFDGSKLAGKSVVALEYAYCSDVEVARHEDISDEGQTVGFPEVKTTAVEKSTKSQNVKASKSTTIVDTVSYSNLVIGKEYTVMGVLMNKATGKALTKEGKTISATKTFVADKTDGTIEMEFTFDSTALKGNSTVVFETITHEGVEVAAHADISDENQTVSFEKEKSNPPKTGDATDFLIFVVWALAIVGAIVLLYMKAKEYEDEQCDSEDSADEQ